MKKQIAETRNQNVAEFLDAHTGIELSDEELRQVTGGSIYYVVHEYEYSFRGSHRHDYGHHVHLHGHGYDRVREYNY